ncbi:MAG: hypothetical protein WD081_05490 [Gammaproteobacteria bacterium]
MNLAPVQAIEGDVLYDGFILYPYREAPLRRQRRWTFGALYPRAYAQQRDARLCSQQVQCLIRGGEATTVEIRTCFLQLTDRQPGRLSKPVTTLPRFKDPDFIPAERIEIGGETHHHWQEALEREVHLPAASLAELSGAGVRQRFDYDDERSFEGLRDPSGRIAAVLLRTRERLTGDISAYSQRIGDGLYRVTVRVENLTPLSSASRWDDDLAARHSLASAHTALSVSDGRLVSLIEPPAEYAIAAAGCVNKGCFPVLVGDRSRCDTLLASPVILYDFPHAAW